MTDRTAAPPREAGEVAQGRPGRRPARRLGHQRPLPDRFHRRCLDAPADPRPRALVISDGRYTTQLQQECPGLEIHIRPVGQPMTEGDRRGRSASSASAGSASRRRPSAWPTSRRLQAEAADRRARRGVRDRVEALRVIKDQGRVAAIREAVDFAERAFAMLRAGPARRGDARRTRPTRWRATCGGAGRRRRASRRSSPSAPASALPHARPTAATRIGEADFVLVDWGADRPALQK